MSKELIDRMTRIESRLVRLMLSLRVDPYSAGTKATQGVEVNDKNITLPSLDMSFTDIRNALVNVNAPSGDYHLSCMGEYLGVFMYRRSEGG